jgi:PAS domain S-box-containing protein
MGVPEIMMLFISAIMLAVAFNHLFLALKIKGTLVQLSIFLAGFIGIAYFMVIYSGYTTDLNVTQLTGLYRLHLVLMQASFLGILWAYCLLFQGPSRRWIIGLISVFGPLILVSLFLPENFLFGREPSATISIVFGSPVTMLGSGTFLWRLLADLSVMVYIGFLISLIINQLTGSNGGRQAALWVGVALVIVAGVADHLSDTGSINMIYLVPLAHFLMFGILSVKSLDHLVEDFRKNSIMAAEDKKWRKMVNEAKVIVLELNTLGQVKYANPYLYQLTGYTEQEMLGKDWFEFLLPKDYSYDVQSAFLEILSHDSHSQYTNPILTKDSGEKVISWYNVRIKDFKGKISGSISIGVDVTEMHNELQKLENDLQQARELISRMGKT